MYENSEDLTVILLVHYINVITWPKAILKYSDKKIWLIQAGLSGKNAKRYMKTAVSYWCYRLTRVFFNIYIVYKHLEKGGVLPVFFNMTNKRKILNFPCSPYWNIFLNVKIH